MSYTYDEILERMNDKFEEISGYEADRVSDIGIRMKVLAGEIYSLGTSIDWIKRQMFPSTATGEQLELHAAQRGLSRNSGKKSRGLISFKLDNPVDYEFIIPMGTICTTSDGSKNFITTADAAIVAGGTLITSYAEAEQTGKQYNVQPDEITTIVTYFSVGIKIETSSSFVGGEDDEDDESLRKRLEYSFKNIPNGANKAYYISLATDVDGVQSASVIDTIEDTGRLDIYAAGRGAGIDATTLSLVRTSILANHCSGISVSVHSAETQSVDVNVSIEVKSGYSSADVSNNVENAIEEFFLQMGVGNKLILAELGEVIFHVEGVQNYSFSNMQDIIFNLRTLPVVGNISVSC